MNARTGAPVDPRAGVSLPDPFAVHVWVLGDVMLDVYLHGTAERLCPEAPVPVVDLVRRVARLGGAANVAHNLVTLGARTTLFGVCGDDTAGSELVALARSSGIETLVQLAPERRTLTKTRVIAGKHQLLRLDEGSTTPLDPGRQREQIAALAAAAPPQVVIISDYLKGTVDVSLMAAVRALSPRPLLLADPKRSDLSFYRACDFVKPNLREAAAVAGCSPDQVLHPEVLSRLVATLGCGLLITRGESGMTLALPGQPPQDLATEARDVFDVTGAGDTVIAAFALALAAGQSPLDAARFANVAAGLAVMRMGTHAVTREEIARALEARSASRDGPR